MFTLLCSTLEGQKHLFRDSGNGLSRFLDPAFLNADLIVAG